MRGSSIAVSSAASAPREVPMKAIRLHPELDQFVCRANEGFERYLVNGRRLAFAAEPSHCECDGAFRGEQASSSDIGATTRSVENDDAETGAIFRRQKRTLKCAG